MDIHRHLGALEARADGHDRENEQIREHLTSMDAKLDKVLEIVSNAKFGLRVVVSVGAAASAIGGFIVAYLGGGHFGG